MGPRREDAWSLLKKDFDKVYWVEGTTVVHWPQNGPLLYNFFHFLLEDIAGLYRALKQAFRAAFLCVLPCDASHPCSMPPPPPSLPSSMRE